MRIFYDYQIFAMQKYGGVSRYFVEIALRINQYPGTRVRVVAPLYRNHLLAAKRNIIPVTGVNYAGDMPRATGICLRFDAAVSRALSMVYRPQLVHETFYSHNRTLGSRAKTVITVYDMINELFAESFPTSAEWRNMQRAAIHRADHVICISESTRADLIRLYNIDPRITSVTHLASSLAPSSNLLPPLEEPYFLYVGNRGGYKNYSGLLAAFGESSLYKTHKFVCFGGGKLGKDEAEQIRRLGIPDHKILMMNGDDELLSRYYSAAVALVYPSLYEGFGIPLLEAMQCGCPVLCSNTSSMPEVAGDAAIYFEPADPQSIASAMLTVAQSPQERRRLISKGRSRAQEFSWDLCARQTYSIYERLLSNA
jgi:glycosyltransferase involved in cell wall biosynthesis